MTLNLKAKIYNDEDAARVHLEKLQWPHGPVCPHCGVIDQATAMKGKSTRPGVYKCRACEKPFSVTVGTVFERSHIPLTKWLLATQLLTSSKKGMSAHQLHRMLGVTYKTAWFMAHRIREAMTPAAGAAPMGGNGKIVEADELYLSKPDSEHSKRRTDGTRYTKKGRSGTANKRAVVALVERGGATRSFHVPGAMDRKAIGEILVRNVKENTRLHTDESVLYGNAKAYVDTHETICHSKGEYARGDVTTNSVEGYFGIFTRGMIGTYQHCGEQHLQRYLNEFDFRYSNRIALGVDDTMRAEMALVGAIGKRLTYRRTVQA